MYILYIYSYTYAYDFTLQLRASPHLELCHHLLALPRGAKRAMQTKVGEHSTEKRSKDFNL